MKPLRFQSGMSLVELMVGMLIGLIGIVIITHLYLTNEEYKRSTTGAGTAQVNGAVALYTMERDIRMAGFGLNHSGALGCSCDTVANPGCSSVQYFYNNTYSSPPGPSGGALPPLAFVPVLITQGVAAADTITLLFGNAPERALPGALSESMPQPSSEFKVDGTAGFAVNDLVLVTQGSTCMLTQITQVQTAASHLQHNPGASSWNPAGGGSLLPAFTQGANLFNLGNPTWRTYSIASNRLQVSEVLMSVSAGATPMQLVDDIVDLQAEYGQDMNDDGVVAAGEWTTVSPTTGAGWQQVIAIRLAVLARSPNYLKPAAGTDCDATTAQPSWAGGSFAAKNFATVTSQDRCYKYRAFETTIPLRNMIWRPA
jgi:type IV pilus assembly protein PilW